MRRTTPKTTESMLDEAVWSDYRGGISVDPKTVAEWAIEVAHNVRRGEPFSYTWSGNRIMLALGHDGDGEMLLIEAQPIKATFLPLNRPRKRRAANP